jgi:hypothetical protein
LLDVKRSGAASQLPCIARRSAAESTLTDAIT